MVNSKINSGIYKFKKVLSTIQKIHDFSRYTLYLPVVTATIISLRNSGLPESGRPARDKSKFAPCGVTLKIIFTEDSINWRCRSKIIVPGY
jgi:hypothetical protein